MNKYNYAIIFLSAILTGACSDDTDKKSVIQNGKEALEQVDSVAVDKTASLKESVSEQAEAVSDKVAEVTEQAKTAVSEWIESVADETQAMQETVKEKADEVTDTLTQTQVPETTTEEVIGQSADKATASVAAVAPALTSAAQDENLATGKKVYDSACQACHATGAAGAPKLDDKANWAPRIAAGMDKMTSNAINGFRGTQGYMPAKGGFGHLSDADVEAAVIYMVSESK